MASVNKVILIGNLGRDPESRHAPSGDMICNLNIATTETWRDRNTGENREATEWHRVVFFGRTAEVAAQYLRKGSQVYVEGRLQTRKWTDKDGNDRYTTEIRGDVMRMLGSRAQQDRSGEYGGGGGGYDDSFGTPAPAPVPAPRPAARPQAAEPDFGLGEDDIPF